MKILAIFLSVIGAIGVVIGLAFWGINNGLVRADEAVEQSYAQVQNVMQRQADLIPNLVETVKGAANFEQKTLTQITEARSKLTAVAKMDPKDLANDPELQKKLVEAQSQVGAAINIVKEAYPQLQSNGNFQSLMASLEGSQNRISTERRKSQQAVQAYNMAIRSWPGSMIAENQGYKRRTYFAASDEAQHAPQVKF